MIMEYKFYGYSSIYNDFFEEFTIQPKVGPSIKSSSGICTSDIACHYPVITLEKYLKLEQLLMNYPYRLTNICHRKFEVYECQLCKATSPIAYTTAPTREEAFIKLLLNTYRSTTDEKLKDTIGNTVRELFTA